MSNLRVPQNWQSPYDATSLITHIGKATTTLAACLVAVSELDGSVIAMTSYSSDITSVPGYPGVTFKRNTGVSASQLQAESGNAFSQMEASLFLLASAITEADVNSGKWAHAAAVLFVCNYEALGMGQLVMQSGYLGEMIQKGMVVVAEIKGLNNCLTQQVGTVTRAECSHDFCDAGCGLNAADYTVPITLTSVTSQTEFADSSLTLPAEYFNNGKFVFSLAPFPDTVAFWRMELSGGTTTDVIGGRVLSAVGEPTSVAGKIGNAVGSLKGTNYLTGTGLYNVGGEWMIWFWCKRSSAETHTLVCGEAAELDPHHIDFTITWDSADAIQVAIADAPQSLGETLGNIHTADNSIPSDGNWHLVVVSMSALSGGFTTLQVVIDNQSPVTQSVNEPIYQMGDLGTPLYVGNGRLTTGGTVSHSIDGLGIRFAVPTTDDLDYLWNGGNGVDASYNANYILRIDSYDEATGTFTLRTPAPYIPRVGDRGLALAGCQKRLVDCQNRVENDGVTTVNNVINRAAFDFVPTLESFTRLPAGAAV